jgi:two-component system, NtrC family, sensor kinase
LLRDGQPIGAIGLNGDPPGGHGYSDSQIALLQAFAEQAVIAITSAETYRALHEALEQQIATSEVLQVINASPGDLAPVFDAILEKAHTLCGAAMGSLVLFDGTHFRAAATLGYTEEYDAVVRQAQLPTIRTQALIGGERFAHVLDMQKVESELDHSVVARSRLSSTGIRTALWMPLRKDNNFLGFISAYRREVQAFSEKEIALLENFATQAVIAMENARLIIETREALEQQTATAEVLQVINASPGDLTPVFDAMLEKAMRLCGAAYGVLRSFDGERMHMLASRGVPPALAEFLARDTGIVAAGTALMRALQTGRPAQNLDAIESVGYKNGVPSGRAIVDLGGARTILYVPLVKDQTSIGVLTFYRQEVRGFSTKSVSAKKSFGSHSRIWATASRCSTKPSTWSHGTASSRISWTFPTISSRGVRHSLNTSATSLSAASTTPRLTRRSTYAGSSSKRVNPEPMSARGRMGGSSKSATTPSRVAASC